MIAFSPTPTVFLADAPTLNISPIFSLWIIIPGILAAVILSLYLYIEQRRIASLASVLFLTLARMLLIIMVGILFLQPALKWTHTHSSAGTVWLVVDQSPSMQTPDLQATPAERLRWAEQMGYLADHANAPDTLEAEIRALAGEFAEIRPLSAGASAAAAGGTAGGATTDRAAIEQFAGELSAWAQTLDKVAQHVDQGRARLNAIAQVPSRSNGNSQGAGDYAAEALRDAGDRARASTVAIRRSDSLREAANAIDAYGIGRILVAAQNAAHVAALNDDTAFLDAHRADPAVTNVLAGVSNMTRADIAYNLLAGTSAPAAKPLVSITEKYHLRIASFADKAAAVGIGAGIDATAVAPTLKNALTPTGQSTNIENALQYVSEQIPVDEAASVIVVTDGRNNVAGDPTGPARNLAARGVHVYGLLVGSHEVSPDAAVEQIDAPDWVYKGDTVRARALIRLDGLTGKSAVVEFRRGENVLQRRTIAATKGHQSEPLDFTDTPPDTEKALEYHVQVTQMPGEVNTQNNAATFRIAVKKDKLYALVIEDRPRWEYRYLSAAMSRDARMKIQTVLLSPGIIAGVSPPSPVQASPQNPQEEAQLLPVTREEWEAFDIIVLGDISPETLSTQAQQFIASAVRDKGATLITIAGQQSMPGRYAGMPLADALPVTFDPQYPPDGIARHMLYGFRPEVAPAAGASVLSQFDTDPAANARLWSHVPLWYWHTPYTRVKPAATVIWTINEPSHAADTDNNDSLAAANKHALLSSLTVGLGHSLFLASDQTWRLRQVNGMNIHERFWGQILRWAAGSDLPAGGKYVRFGANQPVYTQDQPATITARILKDDMTPYTGLTFSVVATPLQRTTASQPATADNRHSVEARFTPMESPGYYTATLGGLPVGDVEFSLRGPPPSEVERLLDTDPTVTQRTIIVRVDPTVNAERRNMNTDAEMLETIAHNGDGYSLDASYASLLLSRLPDIRHTETLASQLGFFTDPNATGTKMAHGIFLAAFALLLTLEWILRKFAGLV